MQLGACEASVMESFYENSQLLPEKAITCIRKDTPSEIFDSVLWVPRTFLVLIKQIVSSETIKVNKQNRIDCSFCFSLCVFCRSGCSIVMNRYRITRQKVVLKLQRFVSDYIMLQISWSDFRGMLRNILMLFGF